MSIEQLKSIDKILNTPEGERLDGIEATPISDIIEKMPTIYRTIRGSKVWVEGTKLRIQVPLRNIDSTYELKDNVEQVSIKYTLDEMFFVHVVFNDDYDVNTGRYATHKEACNLVFDIFNASRS